MARMRRKGDLPTKVCAACGRPFAWRHKWARDWEAVKYCSDACRAAAKRGARSEPGTAAGGAPVPAGRKVQPSR